MEGIAEQIGKRASTLLEDPGVQEFIKERLPEEQPKAFPIGTTAIFGGLLLLFVVALYRAVAKRGQKCSNGWVLPMLLPIVLAAGMSIFINWKGTAETNPYVVMVVFTSLLAVLSYALSVFLIKLNRPSATMGSAARRSIITLVYTLIPSVIAIVNYYVLTTWLPRAFPGIGSKIQSIIAAVPGMQSVYQKRAHWLPATGFGSGQMLIWIPALGMILAPLINFIPWTPLLSMVGYRVACRKA